jgi:hypothetical protein
MLYIRKIEIRRAKTVAGLNGTAIGLTGYSGEQATTDPGSANGETVLFTGVQASIQAGATGKKRGDSALPADAVANPTWDIYLPAGAVPGYGSIRDRDIVVDDVGYRYQVAQAYPNILGWKLNCIRLEV